MLSGTDQTCTHMRRTGLGFERNTFVCSIAGSFYSICALGALEHPSCHLCVTLRPSGRFWNRMQGAKNRCTLGMLGTNELPNTHMCSHSNVHTHTHTSHAHRTKWLLELAPWAACWLTSTAVISRLYFKAAATRAKTTTNFAGTELGGISSWT